MATYAQPSKKAAPAKTPQMLGGDAPETGEKFEAPSNTDLTAMIVGELSDAKLYIEREVGEERATATRYYRGDPFGNEVEGRSQVVSMDLRDTIMAVLPSLVRIFCGSDRYVEFNPNSPDEEDAALARTQVINYVITKDNKGFSEFYTAFKDALIRRYAIFKWWWDDNTEVVAETYQGLLQEQVQSLADDPEVSHVSFEVDGEIDPPDDALQPDADAMPGAPPTGAVPPDAAPPTGAAPPDAAQPAPPSGKVKTYTVRLRREKGKQGGGRARFAVIPGEELLVDRDATCFEDARIVTHQRAVTRSELYAMGIKRELIEEHAGTDFTFRLSEEFLARRPDSKQTIVNFNKDLERTLYSESWIKVDRDGDHIAELTKVCTLGEEYFVVSVDDAPEIPFALLCPDPEPHQLFGFGFYDILKDIQLIKSAILRAILDSLRSSIDPRMAVQDGMVDMNDLLNEELGGIVRTYGPPSAVMTPLTVDFAGREGLGVMDYFDRLQAKRTGQTEGSQGLNADELQSTSEMGIGAQLSAAQQRIEMIARIFAETGIKALFMGLQRLLMRHQDVERQMRINGRWVKQNPATWEYEMDVTVNVGLGNGTPNDRIQFLQGVVAKQEQVLQTFGPTKLVDYHKYSKTLRKATELGGYADGDMFFGELDEGWAPPPPAEKPDPAAILAEAQAKDIQARLQIEQVKAARAHEEMLLRTETDRMKLEADTQLRILELEMKYGAQADEAKVSAALERIRVHTDLIVQAHEINQDTAARRHEAETAAQAQVQSAQAQGGPPAQ